MPSKVKDDQFGNVEEIDAIRTGKGVYIIDEDEHHD